MEVFTKINNFMHEHSVQVAIILGLLALYCLYLYCFKYYRVVVSGEYDTKLKNIGRTLPMYPNGWYVACKSRDLPVGESKAIDMSGHNITLFRSSQGKVYGIHSYCGHLGANLGIGGKVINNKCIQCPFHGWLYDGQTGKCVDYNNKPSELKSAKYNDEMGSKDCKSVTWQHEQSHELKLRTYHVREMHGFIYLWLHSDQNKPPQFEFLNVESHQLKMSNRGYTKHTIRCHVQDIPENGADAFHFRYVHKYPIHNVDCMQFLWVPEWKAGDDPDLHSMFVHSNKSIHQFKQSIYHEIVEPHQHKEYLSIANIDNYILMPFFGKLFVFNLTVIQMGPGLVYIFLKTHFFTVLFLQYVQTHEPYKQVLYHEMFSSNWLPYWLTSIMLRGQAIQVSNDMLIWDSKKFGHKFHYRKNCDTDQFIIKWRTWFSKYYQGCSKQRQDGVDW